MTLPPILNGTFVSIASKIYEAYSWERSCCQLRIVDELLAHFLPVADLIDAAARILVQRNIEAFDQAPDNCA